VTRTGGDRLEKSDHFDGTRFFNPAGTAVQPFSAVPRMLLEPRTPWPARIEEPAAGNILIALQSYYL